MNFRSEWNIPTDSLPNIVNEFDYPENMNVSEAFLDNSPDQNTAIHFKEQRVTYGMLRENVDKLASELSRRVKPGERVILRLSNNPLFLYGWLALIKIGAIPVQTLPFLKAPELRSIAQDSQASTVVTSSDLRLDIGLESLLLDADLPNILRTNSRKSDHFNSHKYDLAMIAYTSGSTGIPKGTLHTHADLLTMVDVYAKEFLKPSPRDVFGGTPPLAFVYGLEGLLAFPLRFGASVVLNDQRFDPQAVLEDIKRYNITTFFSGPRGYTKMLDLAGTNSSLKTCVSAGETLSAELYKKWKDKFGLEILDGMGCTELLSMLIASEKNKTRPGSTGQVVPRYEAKLIDEEGKPSAADKPGQLAIRGPTGCFYLNRPEEQRTRVRNGWMYTGDIFLLDKKGYYTYCGRNDDMININGNKLYPIEVEQAIYALGGIEEVGVFAVNENGVNILTAAIVPRGVKPSAKELVKKLERNLSYYKIPKRVVFASDLPKTPNGKLARKKLGEYK